VWRSWGHIKAALHGSGDVPPFGSEGVGGCGGDRGLVIRAPAASTTGNRQRRAKQKLGYCAEHTNTRVHTHVHARSVRLHRCMRTVHKHTRTHTHVWTLSHMWRSCSHTHARMHTQTHTGTHTRTVPSLAGDEDASSRSVSHSQGGSGWIV